MLFRKKLFKRSSHYLPHQQNDESSMPKLGKSKKSKVPDKAIQVLKMCHTVKTVGGCIRQRIFHGPSQQKTREIIHTSNQPNAKSVRNTESPAPEICALKKAKLACLEKNKVTLLPKTSTQIYNERRSRSQNIKNAQFDHPAFRSSLFMGTSKKENRNRRFGEFRKLSNASFTILQSIDEEDECLYDP